MAAADHDDVEFAGELHGVANFTRSFHVELWPPAVPRGATHCCAAAFECLASVSPDSPFFGFAALIGVVLCFSSAFGFLEVGVVAYASEAAQPALAAVLLGITSAGSAIGGMPMAAGGALLEIFPSNAALAAGARTALLAALIALASL